MTWRDDPPDNAQPICPQCLTNDHIDTLDSIPGHDPNARWTCRPCNLVFNGTIAERLEMNRRRQRLENERNGLHASAQAGHDAGVLHRDTA